MEIDTASLVAVFEPVQVHAGVPAAYNALVALKAALESTGEDARPAYR